MSASHQLLTELYLDEMCALDRFAAQREREGRLLPPSDDPDVRRILEALAFFSARTRAAATASTRAAVRRIAAGTLDDLLPTTPAALLVKATPNEQLVEPVSVPAGTQLRLKAADGRVGLFSTGLPFTVLPATIERASLNSEDRRLFLRVQLQASRTIASGQRWLALHVRQLNDYRSSLALHGALHRYAVGASVRLDGRDRVPCQLHFGPTPPRQLEDETGEPGLFACARAFFHMPDRNLFLHVLIPATPWTRLELSLELDAAFPTNVTLTNDTFHLGVVPVSNVWSDYAEPILCDATRDAYPIRHGNAQLKGVQLHRVRGVYKASDALVPVPPAALSQEGDAYEVDDADEGAPCLKLRAAGAFDKPVKLLVDGSWSQPELWSSAAGKLSVAFQTRHLPGASLAALGSMRRPSPSPLARDPSRALDLLSLRMRPSLERHELASVLEILGTGEDGAYRGAHAWIDELSAVEEPDPAGGVRRRYTVGLRQKSPEDAALVRQLFVQVEALLQGWTEEAVRVDSAIVADAGRRLLGASLP